LTSETVITEELKNMVGIEGEPDVFEVEKGHIRRFAQAIGDPNPLWQDETYANKSGHGGIIAPPTFLFSQVVDNRSKSISRLLKMSPLPRHLNGGTEVECYNPAMPGDVITSRAKLIDLYEKQGKTEKLLFMVIEQTYTNQRGELVAKGRRTFIKM